MYNFRLYISNTKTHIITPHIQMSSDVLLTVHLSTILIINQLNEQILVL
jgi:hypothetical protein